MAAGENASPDLSLPPESPSETFMERYDTYQCEKRENPQDDDKEAAPMMTMPSYRVKPDANKAGDRDGDEGERQDDAGENKHENNSAGVSDDADDVDKDHGNPGNDAEVEAEQQTNDGAHAEPRPSLTKADDDVDATREARRKKKREERSYYRVVLGPEYLTSSSSDDEILYYPDEEVAAYTGVVTNSWLRIVDSSEAVWAYKESQERSSSSDRLPEDRCEDDQGRMERPRGNKGEDE